MNKLDENQKYACNIACLYLSLYDVIAYQKLSEGSVSQRSVHELLSLKFKVKPNYIKNTRDEFDYHVNNTRVGFRRELSKAKKELLNKYKELNEIELYNELQRVLKLDYTSKFTEENDTKPFLKKISKKLKVKQFTILGNDLFKDFFIKAESDYKNSNTLTYVPFDLLNDDNNSEDFEFSEQIEINKIFRNRYELGNYLYDILKNCDEKNIYNNEFLWNWISASLFSSLFPSPRGGGQEIRYILSNNLMYHYRHICYFSWLIFKQFEDKSKVLLTSPVNSISDDYEQIASNRRLLNINFIKLISEMYLIEDLKTKSIKFKKGVNATKKNIPGTVRRLKTIYKRLSSNYYVERMKYRDFKNSVIEFSDEFEQHLN